MTLFNVISVALILVCIVAGIGSICLVVNMFNWKTK